MQFHIYSSQEFKFGDDGVIDLTGVPEVDADSVEGLNRMVGAIGLLGATVILTGLRPEIAAQWAEQEGRINDALSEGSLERGIARALEMIEAAAGDGRED